MKKFFAALNKFIPSSAAVKPIVSKKMPSFPCEEGSSGPTTLVYTYYSAYVFIYEIS